MNKQQEINNLIEENYELTLTYRRLIVSLFMLLFFVMLINYIWVMR